MSIGPSSGVTSAHDNQVINHHQTGSISQQEMAGFTGIALLLAAIGMSLGLPYEGDLY